MESEFVKAGFRLDRQYEMRCSNDYTNPDENLVHVLSGVAKRHMTKEEILAKIRQVYPNEKTDNFFWSLQIFKKSVS
jgi:hypothetical protein